MSRPRDIRETTGSPADARGFLCDPDTAPVVVPRARVAGRRLDFSHVDLVFEDAAGAIARRRVALDEARAQAGKWGISQALDALGAPLPGFAGLDGDRPLIMGVVNVTPDSFSDGGRYTDPGRAIAHGRRLMDAGADILDVGGESTRPGADPVPVDVELSRVVPVVRALAGMGAVVSVDTRHGPVMAAAAESGARIVNDVTALTDAADSLKVVAGTDASVVLMHMKGRPQTMQDAPAYRDVVFEVYRYLEGRLRACEAAGIDRARIALDPGFGFGKTVAQNLELLRGLSAFCGMGCPVLLGVSRKSTIGHLTGVQIAAERVAGSLAAGLEGVARGARILRVHDVEETRQALAVWQAVNAEDSSGAAWGGGLEKP